ncbi:hypothetical protein PoB_000471300 [Plakobranchus ocellatus]|uniref:Uncharacterized protein n=1 Tax=Plakobranchus ocellatus TaxID=259542 RepID=A0AAV3Y712_9GAST|nr:hypothetical protein PoB_000471300 [Plakobranchus ocellatus]
MAGNFKSPERRLEEMLASDARPRAYQGWSGYDVAYDRSNPWQTREEISSLRRFGFHSDTRVNSSDSGLFTAVENDEDPQPEHVQENPQRKKYDKPKSQNKNYESWNFENDYQNLYNFSRCKSQNPHQTLTRGNTLAPNCITHRKNSFRSTQSVYDTHNSQNMIEMLQNADAQMHNKCLQNTKNLLGQTSFVQHESVPTRSACQRNGQHDHDLCEENKHQNRSKDRMIKHQANSAIKSEAWDSPENAQLVENNNLHVRIKTQKRIKDMNNIQNKQQHLDYLWRQQNSRSEYQNGQDATSHNHQEHLISLQSNDHKPENQHQSRQLILTPQISFCSDHPQSWEYENPAFSTDLVQPNCHARIDQLKNIHYPEQHELHQHSPEQNLLSFQNQDSRKAGEQSHTFCHEHSLPVRSAPSGKQLARNKTLHPMNENKFNSSSYLHEAAVGKAMINDRITPRVRRRSKRSVNKLRTDTDSDYIPPTPEQYCFEDFHSSDSDTDVLNASHLSTLAWVRGGLGRHSGQTTLGGFSHGRLGCLPSHAGSNFTRSFLIGNHVSGSGHSQSARSFRTHINIQSQPVASGCHKSQLGCAPNMFSATLRKDFYKPLSDSESLTSDLSSTASPQQTSNTFNLAPSNKVTKHSTAQFIESHFLGKSSNSLPEPSSCLDVDTETENTYEIYENCVVTEPNSGFKFSKTGFQEIEDEHDDSTIYESINPSSVQGDEDDDDPGFVRNNAISTHSQKPSTGVSAGADGTPENVKQRGHSGRQHIQTDEGNSCEDGYMSETFR